ncbi:hypothetical protein CONCODRAFT_80699 [Conidiobolus coronatus NRRL 28638]|uniref:Uncharacterized protein n=1 Tax=Conidiobolus coronatus (strain ATCC 28846 / CBS 209.66 / NRRL 28638) TaxID=796925 RepID=A0A137NSL1_CONC2|nr:hypothetical protein CONCODRAFT_80699 [Conidiobolus coronatus NRRL 28638]|eukprot:KXN65724.1 hypothetical protein CONCODRAFT_80699 [Conidiobolus coronatus NRRL 28638]
MKFAFFAVAIASVACYTKKVTYICNSGSSVQTCNNMFRNAFPKSTWTVQRIMGEGIWNSPNTPSCAVLTDFYKTNCLKLPLCRYYDKLPCSPIDD